MEGVALLKGTEVDVERPFRIDRLSAALSKSFQCKRQNDDSSCAAIMRAWSIVARSGSREQLLPEVACDPPEVRSGGRREFSNGQRSGLGFWTITRRSGSGVGEGGAIREVRARPPRSAREPEAWAADVALSDFAWRAFGSASRHPVCRRGP